METIATRAGLIEMIENLLSVERKARDRYFNESNTLENEKVVTELRRIKKDEDRHIIILESLVELLKK